MNTKSKKEALMRKKHFNPYLLFCIEENTKSSQKGIKETLHTLGQKWNDLPQEVKEKYISQSKEQSI